MIDNGADTSVVSQEFVEEHYDALKHSLLNLPEALPLNVATGSSIEGGCTVRLVELLEMGAYTEDLDLKVIPLADAYDILLGNDWTGLNRAQIDHDPNAKECVLKDCFRRGRA